MTFDGRSAFDSVEWGPQVATSHAGPVRASALADALLARDRAVRRGDRWRVAFCVVALVLVAVVVAVVALGVRYAPTYRGVENWCP